MLFLMTFKDASGLTYSLPTPQFLGNVVGMGAFNGRTAVYVARYPDVEFYVVDLAHPLDFAVVCPD